MIQHTHLENLREGIRKKNDDITAKRIKWINRNPYYYKQLLKTLKFIVPKDSSVLNIRCSIGYVLNRLSPKKGVGVDSSSKQIEQAKRTYPHLNFMTQTGEELNVEGTFDAIVVSSPEDIVDIILKFSSNDITPIVNKLKIASINNLFSSSSKTSN